MRVRTSVVSTIEGAVPRTSVGVGAQRRVPGVAGVAVVATARGVEPAPVRVEDDGVVLGLAVVLPRALLDGEARVVLRRERADLLAVRDSDEGEGDADELSMVDIRARVLRAGFTEVQLTETVLQVRVCSLFSLDTR